VATTATEGTTADTTNPRLAPREGRPDNGAAAAFVGELYARHGATVLGLCRLLLRDPVEAEDAAQQVFVSAQRALLGGAVAREPAAWLVAIARNECRSRIRARMREPLTLPALPADIPDPLASAIHNADLDALWEALSALPRRQRKAFLLRELGGLSYGELGAALGVTKPAVESLLFRARQHLRSLLATVNAALVPVALRDQLVRLLPLGTPGGGASFGAKLAAVTVGVGLGAAGMAELPKGHRQHIRARTPAVAPVTPVHRAVVSEAAAVQQPVVAEQVQHERRRHDAEHRGRGANRSEDSGRDVPERAEPEHEAEVEVPEIEAEPTQELQSGPSPSGGESGPSGGDSSGRDGGGGGSSGGGDSGHGGDSSDLSDGGH